MAVLCSQVHSHGFERVFLKPRHLCLRDADFRGDFHLCFAFKETQGDDFIFTVA